MSRMHNNEPVLFSTWGYCYTPPLDIDDAEIDMAVKNYIVEMGDAAPMHHEGEISTNERKINFKGKDLKSVIDVDDL